jgi:hypothetical protein
MPGLIISVGGKLDKSYSATLQQAAIMAKQEQRRMEMIRTVAPNQLAIVNRALQTLPEASLMRPRLEAMRATLTSSMAGAGAQAGSSFMAKFLAQLGGSGTSQIISVISNTASSFGAGISPARIIAQQLPNLLQSLTFGAVNLLKLLAKIAIVGGSVAAIIAAPFIYLWRVGSIAGNLAKFKLPDLDTGYVARVDSVAESYRKIANAIRETVNQYNSATAAAARAHKVMESQFQLQREIDSINKAREIQNAMGDSQKIAAIEKQYEQLGIQRETAKLDAEKANKIAERAALEKEIAEKQKQIASIGTGGEKAHERTMGDLKTAAEAAKKFLEENPTDEPGWFRRQGRYLSASLRSGGFVAGMANPQGGDAVTKELMAAESAAKRQDIARAQAAIHQYQRMLDLENQRNIAIKEREKLQTEAEKKSQRYAELSMEINAADKEKADILTRMNKLADAKAGQTDQNALFGGGGGAGRELTANQRIGAFAMSHQLTLVDLTRAGNTQRAQTNALLETIAGKPPGIPGFN